MRKRSLALLAMFLISIICVFFNPSIAKAESSAPQDGVDLMIICAHPGDEYLFLSGALPIYAGEQGRSAVVVYLCESDEATQSAAKAALARFGDRVQAVFGSFSASYASTEEEQLRYWDSRAVITYLVGVIREYKPAIVLTHQPIGEYGSGAHIVTSDSAFLAVRYAPEANRYPESFALYGAWQVQRLFFHQYGENMVTLDRSKPIARFDGLTALELDQQGYAYYPVTYPIKITDESGYTSAQYGLASAVDATSFDPAKGDLFAGLDASLLGPTATPYVAPSPTPQATEVVAGAAKTKAATAVPEPVAQMETAPLNDAGFPNGTVGISCAAIGVLALVCAISLKKGTRLKTVAVIVCVIFLLGSAVFAVRYVQSKPVVSFAEVSQDVLKDPAATPVPADSAEPTAEPEPTPTPDPWDQYFRRASDPQEVVTVDLENEHWEYRSDTLSILIDRIHTTKSDGKPITYCIANIRMRGEDAFQAGVRNDNPLAQPMLEHAWHMARRYRAVLGITGDNLIQAEANEKGILMRNGKIYSRNQAQDTLAFFPNDLTIKVFKPKTISAEELQEEGVLNTFSFGPTLLNNGVRDLESRYHSRIGKWNPRCGIGMVEPGHFIAITVDGRQLKYSVGMTIEEFTQLFYLLGCQTAYNLDGGASTAMVFMGECLSQHSGIGSDVQRPWTDGLFWGKSELVPSVDDPVYNDGSKPWVIPPA